MNLFVEINQKPKQSNFSDIEKKFIPKTVREPSEAKAKNLKKLLLSKAFCSQKECYNEINYLYTKMA